GSLITAGFALDQGRTVYALPGQVGDALSRGCNRLIFDGAGIAFSPEILLEEWGIREKDSEKTTTKKQLGLEREMELVYSCLNLRPQSLEEIIQKTGFSPALAGSVLTRLALMGLAKETGRHFYVREKL
ncbi:MAG: DNA-processing protein DprA, partial [Eubacteriales bacterium]|nr:DNA-processing protein DprA [Eubacteriales bacterium]